MRRNPTRFHETTFERFVCSIVLIAYLVLYSQSGRAQTDPVEVPLSVTATVVGEPGVDNGGGGGGNFSSPTEVIFSGRAYPLSVVILLKDGVEVVNTIAGPDAKFEIKLSNLSSGTYTFSLLSEDSAGRRSIPFTIPIMITKGASTTVSGIFLAPTIDIDKEVVKRGDILAIFGQSVPSATITIEVHSDQEITAVVPTDAWGTYLYNLNTTLLSYGEHDTSTRAELVATNEITTNSQSLTFVVGDQNIYPEGACVLSADLNNDCRVNLVDFSILAFWYLKPFPPTLVDLNGDGKVTLIDFSIMAFYWTG